MARKAASRKVSKASKRSATSTRGKTVKKAGRKVASKVKKAGKSMMHKMGLDKPAVKKRVVTKIKRVGAAMARAAMDELAPQTESNLPGAKTAAGKDSSSPRSGRGGGR